MSEIQACNFRGHTYIFKDTSTKNAKQTFYDIALVRNESEAKMSVDFHCSHIVCLTQENLKIDLFQYTKVDTNEGQHWERLQKKGRMALVRAVFSSNGTLCDSIDTFHDPEMESFLFTDRPDLVPSSCQSKIVHVPNVFGKPQIAAKHVKW